MKLYLILFAAFFAGSSWAESFDLQIQDHAIRAELAETPASWERGLKGRGELCENCGMLFAFRVAGPYALWMKDTALPLSVAFVSPAGRILNITDMQPNTDELHYAEGDALFALEMPHMWFTMHDIKPGHILCSSNTATRLPTCLPSLGR